MKLGRKKYEIPSPPFSRAVVHTNGHSNTFTIEVNDLEWALKHPEKWPAEEISRITLARALFIQQAIEEKLDKGGAA